MSGSATLYLEQNVLLHTLASQAFPMPLGVFVGLCTTVPSAQNRGTEVSGGGYARQNAQFQLLTTPPNVAANAVTIEFPAATAAWGIIGWFELWDTPSGPANRLYWGTLVNPVDGVTPITRQVEVGDIMRFSAGVLQVQAI